jgi:hypothetical protein
MSFVISIFAVIDYAFPGWISLEEMSDILVARCLRTPDPYNQTAPNGMHIDPLDGLIGSEMETVFPPQR